MDRTLILILATSFSLSCSGGHSPPVSEPDDTGGGEQTDEACWDEQPCPGFGDLHCLPPGTLRPSGKAPEHVGFQDPLPEPCENDGDCDPVNEQCVEGNCIPASCDSSDACDGYCVGGRCWSEPGFCQTYLLP